MLKSNPELKYEWEQILTQVMILKPLLRKSIVLVSESIFYGTLLYYSEEKI